MIRAFSIPLIAVLVATSACSDDTGVEPDVDAGIDAGEAPILVPELYPADRTLSPLTAYIVDNLRDIAARAPDRQNDVFAKVGDAATMSINFMHCFDDGYANPRPEQEPGNIDLDGRDDLEDTIALFRDGDAAGANPYNRTSMAAAVGWQADAVLGEPPNPLSDEYQAIDPRFSVILFGANDIDDDDIDAFGSSMLDIADQSIENGVIPIFTSTLPRADDLAIAARVPAYNAVVRGVAQARQVPFIDLYRDLASLEGQGLGPDGVHPSVYRSDDQNRACVFDAQGLQHGYNARNLLTIQTLDRLRRAVLADEDAPDVFERTTQGAGTANEPFVIDGLPFTHVANTGDSDSRNIDLYDGCQANQNESGAEIVYRFEVQRATRIRAAVIDRGMTDIDVHLLQGSVEGTSCIARAHQVFTADVKPGTHYFSLDTFVGSGGEQSGEYLFTVTEEPM